MKKIQVWLIILLLVLISVFGMIYYNKNSQNVDLAPAPSCKCPHQPGDWFEEQGNLVIDVNKPCPDTKDKKMCSNSFCLITVKNVDGTLFQVQPSCGFS